MPHRQDLEGGDARYLQRYIAECQNPASLKSSNLPIISSNMKIITHLVLSIMLSLSGATLAKEIKIYVLTGQSNSLGTTANKKDKDPANPPRDEIDEKIAFFWSNRSTAAADGPAAIIGDSGGKITTLQKQQGQGRNPSFWGPEIALGRELYKSGKRDFLIVKASRGGGGNGYWVKGGQMYEHVLTTVKSAVAELEKHGHSFNIAAMFYIQGESDSAQEAKISGERLGQLVDNLKVDLPNAKEMRTIVGGIAAGGKSRDLTRKQQKELAKSREDIVYISNTNLKSHLYDRLHFDKSAKLTIGRRFAREVLK